MESSTEIIVNLITESTKAKVDEFNLHLFGEKDVLEFNVTMNDVFGLKVG